MKYYKIATTDPHDFSSDAHAIILTETSVSAYYTAEAVLAWISTYLTYMADT